eukprot:CAMPEP_0117434492 /NCGR_PEP_ID=MMETSP0758-20121206/13731_1 /TAXON_ID=63605 /ORGANISM="Percolomonas cosmopolitus, Strain AE-1 (ATCC 50343)" /LENGTH=284 /DNA_ID=CAMNT_0005225965 /DNA_START=1034 /DNA_END=1891 /DNA_ORIENTATION=+
MNVSTHFVPNDIQLGTPPNSKDHHPNTIVVTGPNMGGKSTILRQLCIAMIMAQMGSYVPAESMIYSPIDRVFTRIGASDRMLSGESTFMVEMRETAAILMHATSRSLVILDELGRGTSTVDGYSIAYAVLLYLVERKKALTLFSTHYHDLCKAIEYHPHIDLYYMDSMVTTTPNGLPLVKFLYTFKKGFFGYSYGMNVARLAGLPDTVVSRAVELSKLGVPTFETEDQMKDDESERADRLQTFYERQNTHQQAIIDKFTSLSFTSLEELRSLQRELMESFAYYQ